MTLSLLALSTIVALMAAPRVQGHGMIVSPNGFGDSGYGSVREWYKVGYSINDLRNPTYSGSICRGTGRGNDAANVYMQGNGGYHSVTLAFSIGAQHIGECGIEIFDADNPYDRVLVGYAGGYEGCAVAHNSNGNEVTPYISTDKYPSASAQCRGYVTPGTEGINDMCTFQWTFRLQRMDQVRCRKCVMRWFWKATHNAPNYEFYDNCIDINLQINGGNNRAALDNFNVANLDSLDPKRIAEERVMHLLSVNAATSKPDFEIRPESAKVFEKHPSALILNSETAKAARIIADLKKGVPAEVALGIVPAKKTEVAGNVFKQVADKLAKSDLGAAFSKEASKGQNLPLAAAMAKASGALKNKNVGPQPLGAVFEKAADHLAANDLAAAFKKKVNLDGTKMIADALSPKPLAAGDAFKMAAEKIAAHQNAQKASGPKEQPVALAFAAAAEKLAANDLGLALNKYAATHPKVGAKAAIFQSPEDAKMEEIGKNNLAVALTRYLAKNSGASNAQSAPLGEAFGTLAEKLASDDLGVALAKYAAVHPSADKIASNDLGAAFAKYLAAHPPAESKALADVFAGAADKLAANDLGVAFRKYAAAHPVIDEQRASNDLAAAFARFAQLHPASPAAQPLASVFAQAANNLKPMGSSAKDLTVALHMLTSQEVNPLHQLSAALAKASGTQAPVMGSSAKDLTEALSKLTARSLGDLSVALSKAAGNKEMGVSAKDLTVALGILQASQHDNPLHGLSSALASAADNHKGTGAVGGAMGRSAMDLTLALEMYVAQQSNSDHLGIHKLAEAANAASMGSSAKDLTLALEMYVAQQENPAKELAAAAVMKTEFKKLAESSHKPTMGRSAKDLTEALAKYTAEQFSPLRGLSAAFASAASQKSGSADLDKIAANDLGVALARYNANNRP
ncbi:hypothetical protein HDU97_002975 [Phlyctochytrium planicorne]|nr:hypothetical protein HDU97_002975 [Phlyctochytrium planicorne]